MLVAEGDHEATVAMKNSAETVAETPTFTGFGANLAEKTGSLLAHKPAPIFSITISGA